MTTKKDEKDADRPHYYSQFWLDVAAGRRVIGTPKSEDGSDDSEVEAPEPTPIKSGRAATLPVDGYREPRPAAVEEPDYTDDEFNEPEPEEEAAADNIDLGGDLDDEDIPNIVVDDAAFEDEPDDLDLALAEEEDEDEDGEDLEDEEDLYDDEEDEDEEDWQARGRKKPKPGRQVKAPKPSSKKPKRGRGF